MTLLPDVAELDAIARQIAGHADAARARAGTLARAARTAGWHGSAASAFASSADDTGRALRTAADRLDTAARVLHRHARAVEHTLSVLHAVAVRTGRTVDEVLGGLDDAGHALGADAASALGDVGSLLSGAAHLAAL